MQGKLIVFEGGEGSGKTTQIDRSHQWLSHTFLAENPNSFTEVIVTREPGGTPLASEIRRLLLTTSEESPHDRTELLLYAADRAQHVEHLLKPKLAAGALILCDRYTDSTIAYQGYGRGLDLSLIHQLNAIATNGLKSDLTLWLDVDAELGISRSQKRGTLDRIERANLAFHQRVRQGFTALHQQQPDRLIRIDASLHQDEVFQNIQAILQQRLAAWHIP